MTARTFFVASVAVAWMAVPSSALAAPPAMDSGFRGWSVAFTSDAPGSRPRRITEDLTGSTTLWATGPRSLRATFPPGGVAPEISEHFPVRDQLGAIAVSASGLVVRTITEDARLFRAVLESSDGARDLVEQRVTRAQGEIRGTAIAVGADGTAAVAWAVSREFVNPPPPAGDSEQVFMRTRPPGGSFGPPELLAERAPVQAMDLEIGADGTIELAYQRARIINGNSRYELMHAQRPAGGALTAPEFVARTNIPSVLEMLPGGPGRRSMIFYADSEQLFTVHATGNGWSNAQVLLRPDGGATWSVRPAPLSNGGALVVWFAGYESEIGGRRAGADGRFGRPELLARDHGDWRLGGPSVAVNPQGGAAVTWVESYGADNGEGDTSLADSCPGKCDARALVTVAVPGGSFEPASPASPLGSNIAEDFAVAGLDHTGRPAAAWLESADSTLAPGRMMLAFGQATPSRRLQRRSDHRPPRSFARATLTGVRAAARGRALRVGVRCHERCVARVALHAERQSRWFGWPTEFGATREVLNAGRPSVVVVRVKPRLRPRLERRLVNGVLSIRMIATDRAGNAQGRNFPILDR